MYDLPRLCLVPASPLAKPTAQANWLVSPLDRLLRPRWLHPALDLVAQKRSYLLVSVEACMFPFRASAIPLHRLWSDVSFARQMPLAAGPTVEDTIGVRGVLWLLLVDLGSPYLQGTSGRPQNRPMFLLSSCGGFEIPLGNESCGLLARSTP